MNLVTIKSLYNTFSKQEKLIADYVLKFPNIVTTLSVSDFSEKLKVGNATIVRYCKKVGVSGF